MKDRSLIIYVLLVCLLILGLTCAAVVKESKKSECECVSKIDTIYVQSTRSDTITAMADAFSYVESRNTSNAVSPCGNYVGCLQISKICVREANRILKDSIFSYNDRYDKIMSYAIFEVLQNKYNPTLDIDKAVDIWNKNCFNCYRDTVKKQYFENLKNL